MTATADSSTEGARQPKVRILLAEDHATVREGLKLILNNQPDMEVIAEAGDGATTIDAAVATQPDIVVLDISMPGINGLKVAERLGGSCPGVKVLALTRHSDDGYLQQLLRAGAVGYVLKQSRPSELVHAIRAIAAGGTYLDPAIADKLVGGARRSSAMGLRSGLSSRESQILRLIAWGHSNKEIAAQLDLSVKTVETHKANAMQKLGMTSRIDIVRYALLQGWLQTE